MTLEEYFEVCRLVCGRAAEYLKERCRGYVRVRVDFDVMNIEINKEDFQFKYAIPNFVENVHNVTNFEIELDECLRTYKAAVLKKFFKEHIY